MKESLEGTDLSRDLDLITEGKLHVLFGGTKLVQHTPPNKAQAHLKGIYKSKASNTLIVYNLISYRYKDSPIPVIYLMVY